MRKILEAMVGDLVMDIRNGEQYKVKKVNPFIFRKLTDDTYWKVQADEMKTVKRWFKVTEETTEPEIVDVVSVVAVETVEEPVVAPAMTEHEYFVESLLLRAEALGCELRETNSYIGIRYNGKNVAEFKATKKKVHLTVREAAFDETMLAFAVEYLNGKMVNATWTLNYRVYVSNIEEFTLVLKKAIAHIEG